MRSEELRRELSFNTLVYLALVVEGDKSLQEGQPGEAKTLSNAAQQYFNRLTSRERSKLSDYVYQVHQEALLRRVG